MEYSTHTKIKFLHDARYCEDGFKVERGMKGDVREVENATAADLIKRGNAEVVA